MSHQPVLLKESIAALCVKNARIIDATFGGGGHTKAILAQECNFVCGIDRDKEAAERAVILAKQYPDNFCFMLGKFSNISILLKDMTKFDAVLFDFGVSSFQLDEAQRGFSFSKEGNLDMRMSCDDKITAYDVVNSFSEENLANIIWSYGDERNSRKIAAKIVQMRKILPIKTTCQLKDAVGLAYKNIPKKNSKIDVATKTFQAIRIYVNNELAEIDTGLKNIFNVLNDGARIVTISFHSLEDRVVKNWARDFASCLTLSGGIIKPSKQEIMQNARSRSAILRSFVYNKMFL